MDRPVPAQETYMVTLTMRSRRPVEGMKAYVSKTGMDMIVTQVNLMCKTTEIFQSIHGESEYNTIIVNLLCQLPGAKRVNRSAGMESSTQQSSMPTG